MTHKAHCVYSIKFILNSISQQHVIYQYINRYIIMISSSRFQIFQHYKSAIWFSISWSCDKSDRKLLTSELPIVDVEAYPLFTPRESHHKMAQIWYNDMYTVCVYNRYQLNARCCCFAFDSWDVWLYEVVLFLMCSSMVWLGITGLTELFGSNPKSLSNDVIELERTWFRTMASIFSNSAVMEWNSLTNDWSEITEIELATLELVGIVVCWVGKWTLELAELLWNSGPDLLKWVGEPIEKAVYLFVGDTFSGDMSPLGMEAGWWLSTVRMAEGWATWVSSSAGEAAVFSLMVWHAKRDGFGNRDEVVDVGDDIWLISEVVKAWTLKLRGSLVRILRWLSLIALARYFCFDLLCGGDGYGQYNEMNEYIQNTVNIAWTVRDRVVRNTTKERTYQFLCQFVPERMKWATSETHIQIQIPSLDHMIQMVYDLGKTTKYNQFMKNRHVSTLCIKPINA